MNLNSIMLGSEQPDVMGDFYTKVFGRNPDMTEDGWHGWQMGACFFGVGAHSEVKGKSKEPSRIMLNLEVAAEEIKAEFERIKSAGAQVIKELYEMGEGSDTWIGTFADPDGNFFQLMTPFKK